MPSASYSVAFMGKARFGGCTGMPLESSVEKHPHGKLTQQEAHLALLRDAKSRRESAVRGQFAPECGAIA